ncbi:MAG: ParB N-terminal domain-containing protein [Acidobacteria bacterium]|nr:ParB N-terminal domain-containing protein [Acidobacteriota bacterium]
MTETKRGPSRYLENPNDLVIIGRDTAHKSRAEHFLFDKRALVNPDPEFVDSIKAYGVQMDVWTRLNKETGKREVVAGRRRVIAARLAGLDSVPTSRLAGGDIELMALSRLENSGRLEEDMLSKAEAAFWLLEQQMPHEEVASCLSWSPAMLRVALQGLALVREVPEIRTGIEKGIIAPSAVAILGRLTAEEARTKYAELLAEAAEDGKTRLPRAQVAAKARATSEKTDRVPPPPKRLVTKLYTKITEGEIDAPEGTSEDFWAGVRFAYGEVKPERIKGLKKALDIVAAKKLKTKKDETTTEAAK